MYIHNIMPYRRTRRSKAPRGKPRYNAFKRRRGKRNPSNFKLDKVVKALVKTEINKGREKKVIDLVIGNDLAHPSLAPNQMQRFQRGEYRGYLNSQGVGGADTWIVFPEIPQLNPASLVKQGAIQRVGNRIQPKSFYVKGSIYLDPLENVLINSDFTGINVRVMLVSSKKRGDYQSLADVAPGTQVDGYRTGALAFLKSDGSTMTYDGSYYRHHAYRTNTDQFTVHGEKNFLMTREQVVFSNAQAPVGNQHMSNRNFFLKCPLPKTLKYSSDATNIPSAFAPYLIAMYSFTNGASSAVLQDFAGLKIWWTSRTTYTDA